MNPEVKELVTRLAKHYPNAWMFGCKNHLCGEYAVITSVDRLERGVFCDKHGRMVLVSKPHNGEMPTERDRGRERVLDLALAVLAEPTLSVSLRALAYRALLEASNRSPTTYVTRAVRCVHCHRQVVPRSRDQRCPCCNELPWSAR